MCGVEGLFVWVLGVCSWAKLTSSPQLVYDRAMDSGFCVCNIIIHLPIKSHPHPMPSRFFFPPLCQPLPLETKRPFQRRLLFQGRDGAIANATGAFTSAHTAATGQCQEDLIHLRRARPVGSDLFSCGLGWWYTFFF